MLWLYEETQPFSFSLADELTEIRAALIARCAMGGDDPEPCAVIDLAAARMARMAEGGSDA
jgi:hypothetical protein